MKIEIVKYIFGAKPQKDCIPYKKEVPGRKEKEYFAIVDNHIISKLWESFGSHENSVGNWGGFETDEKYRRQGIGRQVLDFWYNDINNRNDKPLAYFCTAGKQYLADLYRNYGFYPALKGTTYGYLYCPIGDSPKTFQDFCEQYYTDTDKLTFRKVDYDYRVEIDCLFKFAMADLGLSFSFDNVSSVSDWLEGERKGILEFIFTSSKKVAGWAYTPENSTERQIIIFPKYKYLLK